MSSSRKYDLILSVYNDKRSVFTLNDIAMLICESNFKRLNERLHLLSRPKRVFSDIFIPFTISMMVKSALFESFFLKNMLISDKIVLFLSIGIGLIVFFVLVYLNVLKNSELQMLPMPFFMQKFFLGFNCET
jgi:hypothetical protein